MPEPSDPSDKERRSPLDFHPVQLRYRHDGWTPERQSGFVRALAETGCVEEAVRRVGMSASGAYDLRQRIDAQSFRFAWDAAVDMAMLRMSDAAISRCIHGIPVPHFYKGEQVGEHRRYDERLTMWLMRYRDPATYGKWRDRVPYERHPDGPALTLVARLMQLWDDVWKELRRRPPALGSDAPEPDLAGDAPPTSSTSARIHGSAAGARPRRPSRRRPKPC
jgi:hypothetical protein